MRNLLACTMVVLAGSLSGAMAMKSFYVEVPQTGSGHITITHLSRANAQDVWNPKWTGSYCTQYTLDVPPSDSSQPPLHFRIWDSYKPGETKIGAWKELLVPEVTTTPVVVVTYEYAYKGIEDPDWDLVCEIPAAYLEHYDVQIDSENARLLHFKSKSR